MYRWASFNQNWPKWEVWKRTQSLTAVARSVCYCLQIFISWIVSFPALSWVGLNKLGRQARISGLNMLSPRFSNCEITWRNKSGKNYWPTFLWYDTDHTENDASDNSSIVACVFIATGTCLPSRCLVTMKGYTYRHRHTGLTTDEILEMLFSLRSDPKLYIEGNSVLKN
jgi:hypothetical protein